MKTFIQLVAMCASLLIFLTFFISIWFMIKWYVVPITDLQTPTTFNVPAGISTKKLIDNLYQDKLINNREYLLWLAIFKGDMTKIKTGEYQINPGQTADSLLTALTKGKGIMRKITLIEGWTFQQVIGNLNQNPYITHTLHNQTPEQIMAALGHRQQPAEGMFYPDTYLFAQGTSDVKILTIAYNLMQKNLNAAWQTRAPNLPYQTPYQALIVASMVEKEATLNKERPQVAGVILKRLALGMRLQIDATLIYGNGADYSKPLTRVDLQTDSAYNTYTRNGLPPTPIAMPSEFSLQAALQPVITDAVYYVAKGDGSHIFSQHLAGHNEAVNQYRDHLKLNIIIANAHNRQSTSALLMLKYWQGLANPHTMAMCLYVS